MSTLIEVRFAFQCVSPGCYSWDTEDPGKPCPGQSVRTVSSRIATCTVDQSVEACDGA